MYAYLQYFPCEHKIHSQNCSCRLKPTHSAHQTIQSPEMHFTSLSKSFFYLHTMAKPWETNINQHCWSLPKNHGFKVVLLWSWRPSIRLGPANPCEIDRPCSRGRTWCFLWLGSGVDYRPLCFGGSAGSDYGVHQQSDWTLEIQFSIPQKNKPPTPQNLQWV